MKAIGRTAIVVLLLLVSSHAAAAYRFGTAGADLIVGTARDDYLSGESDDDRLFARAGDDILDGGNDQDTLLAGGGVDLMIGRDGTSNTYIDDDSSSFDRINATETRAFVFAADGVRTRVDCGSSPSDFVFADTIDAISAACEVVRTARATTERFGNNSDNTLNGDGLENFMFGKNGDDVLNGRGDDDQLLPGGGEDAVNGSGGEDVIVDDDSQPGDRLRGGADSDFFFAADGARDEIDCGASDGAVDTVIADRADVIRNCAGDTVVRR